MNNKYYKANKNSLEVKVHLVVKVALYKLVHNQDTDMDTEQNHSMELDNIDNTVDMQVFAVEWWMQH